MWIGGCGEEDHQTRQFYSGGRQRRFADAELAARRLLSRTVGSKPNNQRCAPRGNVLWLSCAHVTKR
jgi:hypothetical protein